MLKEVVCLKPGDFIEYIPRTDNYGCAEFFICPVFSGVFIKELHITPLQQVTNKVYVLKLNPGSTYQQVSFSPPIDSPINIWMSGWCSIHNCYGLRFYVPKDERYTCMYIEPHCGDTIGLEWKL